MKIRMIRHFWAILLSPLLLGARLEFDNEFYFLPNNVGPFKEGENYRDTIAIGSRTKQKEVKFEVAVYKNGYLIDNTVLPDWLFMNKKSPTYFGEKLYFVYEIPKEMVFSSFDLRFTIFYMANPAASYSFSYVFSIRSKSEHSSPVSLLENSVFFGASIHEIEKEQGNERSSFYPTLKVDGVKEVVEAEEGTFPFFSSFLFSFYDDYNHEPLSFPLSRIEPHLEIIGPEAKEFASFCDEYRTSYLGDVASFALDAMELKQGTYRFLLGKNKYAVNRYNGFMRKATSLHEDEVFTREIHLPYERKKDTLYKMRFVTYKEDEEFNIPKISTTFYCYKEKNPFGNALNSAYYVREEI